MTKYVYRVVFPDGHTEDINQIPDENGFIKDILDEQFKELTGFNVRDIPRNSDGSCDYKLLYIGEVKE
jgi:hypothetical protein